MSFAASRRLQELRVGSDQQCYMIAAMRDSERGLYQGEGAIWLAAQKNRLRLACKCVTPLAKTGLLDKDLSTTNKEERAQEANHRSVAAASHAVASAIVPAAQRCSQCGSAWAQACNLEGASTPSSFSNAKIDRRILLVGSSQSVPHGWPPGRGVGKGALGRCIGASVRGASRSSNNQSKGAAQASRRVRKAGRSNNRLTVATIDVPSNWDVGDGFVRGVETTVPFGIQGLTTSTGTLLPSRE